VVRLALVLLLAITMAGGAWWHHATGVKTQLNVKIRRAEVELGQLNETKRIVQRAEASRIELAAKLAAVERLQQARQGAVRLVQDLSRSVPNGLWLVAVKQSGASVQVDGRSLSIGAVTNFAEALQRSDLFQRPIEILAVNREALEDTAVFAFAVKATVATSSLLAP
jgi:type IV pilus assembly protein PilN